MCNFRRKAVLYVRRWLQIASKVNIQEILLCAQRFGCLHSMYPSLFSARRVSRHVGADVTNVVEADKDERPLFICNLSLGALTLTLGI